MKEKVIREVEIEIVSCNICSKEITSEPFNKERIKIIKFLFDTSNFDAHEACINAVIKEAVTKYIKN